MATKTWFISAVLLTAVAAGALGFDASHVLDGRMITTLTTERDTARDCRHSGATVAPCPVVYRNTRVEWRDRIETVHKPDPRQAARIIALSAEVAREHRTIRNLERWRARPRAIAVTGWQNGTMQHPYSSDERCPSGSVAVYDAGLSTVATARRRTGDPNVCYVLTKLHRLAMSTTHG